MTKTKLKAVEKGLLKNLSCPKIRLTKWDPYMFAQGVVIFGFGELLPQAQSPHAPESPYFGRLPDQGIFSLELAPQLRVDAQL